MNWLEFGGERSRSQQAVDVYVCEDIHTEAGASKSIYHLFDCTRCQVNGLALLWMRQKARTTVPFRVNATLPAKTTMASLCAKLRSVTN